ncbi:hypothetical protein QR680_003780 [Steinernema hermaphroditum]|uniref:Uncharacterized protein n=1 Tax=Steinernema hermaphroditum TaxID=289476 RepID=A0AA39HLI8_9BILA|nr:hypothetical protein QR680_003780 [Steinernema hermaphroditum]
MVVRTLTTAGVVFFALLAYIDANPISPGKPTWKPEKNDTEVTSAETDSLSTTNKPQKVALRDFVVIAILCVSASLIITCCVFVLVCRRKLRKKRLVQEDGDEWDEEVDDLNSTSGNSSQLKMAAGVVPVVMAPPQITESGLHSPLKPKMRSTSEDSLKSDQRSAQLSPSRRMVNGSNAQQSVESGNSATRCNTSFSTYDSNEFVDRPSGEVFANPMDLVDQQKPCDSDGPNSPVKVENIGPDVSPKRSLLPLTPNEVRKNSYDGRPSAQAPEEVEMRKSAILQLGNAQEMANESAKDRCQAKLPSPQKTELPVPQKTKSPSPQMTKPPSPQKTKPPSPLLAKPPSPHKIKLRSPQRLRSPQKLPSPQSRKKSPTDPQEQSPINDLKTKPSVDWNFEKDKPSVQSYSSLNQSRYSLAEDERVRRPKVTADDIMVMRAAEQYMVNEEDEDDDPLSYKPPPIVKPMSPSNLLSKEADVEPA